MYEEVEHQNHPSSSVCRDIAYQLFVEIGRRYMFGVGHNALSARASMTIFDV